VQPGDKVLILMPGEIPGSVGDLLVKGLARMGVDGLVHGLVKDPERVIDEIDTWDIDCLVGLPVQVLALARHPEIRRIPRGRIKSILLSADNVPAAIVAELSRVFGARVYNHYGMTEMALGGGVECSHLCGYHLREADLYFEVIDPVSGDPLPDGTTGEVVFTTLTRVGMPLIRYRTGDFARFLPEPCPCGTMLRRLERVQGRAAGDVWLGPGNMLNITEMDEALFRLPFMLDYQARLTCRDGRDRLDVTIQTTEERGDGHEQRVRQALQAVFPIFKAVVEGRLVMGEIGPEAFARTITMKRTVLDRRRELSC
jgi:phenylacetate-coenzyme A ligase PaaK-like adenylate-forming protein